MAASGHLQCPGDDDDGSDGSACVLQNILLRAFLLLYSVIACPLFGALLTHSLWYSVHSVYCVNVLCLCPLVYFSLPSFSLSFNSAASSMTREERALQGSESENVHRPNVCLCCLCECKFISGQFVAILERRRRRQSERPASVCTRSLSPFV